MSEIELRKLSACSLDDALRVWNEGFTDYFVDLSLTMNGFLSRLHVLGISPEHSLIAYIGNRPIGIVLNGIREIREQKIAWNGGTAVSTEFRGKGVGALLVEAAINLYKSEQVDIATLEAISDNRSAIGLYQKYGYEISDHLVFFERNRAVNIKAFSEAGSYSIQQMTPAFTGSIDFYPAIVPWQVQWQSVLNSNGEALVLSDKSGIDIGYALYRRTFDERGRVTGITLYQCEARPDRKDREAIVCRALQRVFAPLEVECRRGTHNLRRSNDVAVRVLERAGFTVFIEQVHMILHLKK